VKTSIVLWEITPLCETIVPSRSVAINLGRVLTPTQIFLCLRKVVALLEHLLIHLHSDDSLK